MLDAAAHGLGIALARPPLAREQLAAGRIVRADEREALNPVSYWLDRPFGTLRPSAAALAERIAGVAGAAPADIEAFLSREARAA